MAVFSKPKWWRWIAAVVLIAFVVCAIAAFVFLSRKAYYDARRSNAYGRLCQMRAALKCYEQLNGTLPPRCVRDDSGEAVQSWRALILPHLEVDSLRRFDLSEPWDSAGNRKVVANTPTAEWTWFARDIEQRQGPVRTYIFALVGPDSMWDTVSDLPRGTTTQSPQAILLVSVEESDVAPMEPGDLSEEAVREMVTRGESVLFVTADVPHGYGMVAIENGKLAFHTWQEVLERKNAAP